VVVAQERLAAMDQEAQVVLVALAFHSVSRVVLSHMAAAAVAGLVLLLVQVVQVVVVRVDSPQRLRLLVLRIPAGVEEEIGTPQHLEQAVAA
jgi:hypothetical protein